MFFCRAGEGLIEAMNASLRPSNRAADRCSAAFVLRAVLGPMIALVAGSAGATGVEPGATAARGRLELLYADQVLFARDGEPLIPVRLLEGRRRIRLRSASGLTLAPGDDAGSRVVAPPGTGFTLSLREPHRGRTRSWVVAERFSGRNLDRVATARARWRGMGHEVRVFEAGTLLGLGGQTLDTRAVTIAISPAATVGLARRKARQIAGRARILGTIHDEYLQRPGGWVDARSESGVTVSARDLLSIAPVDPEGEIELLGVRWPRHGVEDRRYRGKLFVLVGTDRRLTVVNLVRAETLIEGVVPSEIFPNAPRAALEAQAVAARGMLMSKIGVRHQGEPYQLCAEPHCQSYTGAGSATEATTAAVRATHGQMLVDDGRFTDTVYHSACGGHTEAWHAMWGGSRDRNMPGVGDGQRVSRPRSEADVERHILHPPEAWCAPSGRRSRVFRWSVERPGAQISAAVNARQKVGPVHTIRVLERGRSGRVLLAEYVGTEGRHRARGAPLNRRLLGGLKSSLWIARRNGGAPDGEPDSWTIHGGGFGHGVGLCQHGAIGLARAGRDVRAILRHYYPGARLEKLW